MRFPAIYPSDFLREERTRLMEELDAGTTAPEDVYNQLLELDSLDIVALTGLSELKQEQGDYEAAASYLWRAVESQPCFWPPYIALTKIYDRPDTVALKNALAELGLRKVRLDPEGLEEFLNAPVPQDLEDEEPDAEDFDDEDSDEDDEPGEAEKLDITIDVLRERRDFEPLEVTARLRPLRMVHRTQQGDDLDEESVDAIVNEGEAFLPWLIGILRSHAQNPAFEEHTRMVEITLALMGEMGIPDVLPMLIEFSDSDYDEVAGPAGWAIARLLELQPEPTSSLIRELAPGLNPFERMALADALVGPPSAPHAESLLEHLAESETNCSPGQLGFLFSAIVTSLISLKTRTAREVARRLVRRHADRLGRNARRRCNELLEDADQLIGDALPSDDERWTIYDICAGEAYWSDFDDDDDFDEDFDPLDESEPAGLSLVTPIKKQPAPGRNDPCPCGSGKKYKKCHLDSEMPF